ncbi:MAG: hypothetical protein V4454_12560 [Pseudomonadota bacterium]
MLASHFTVLLRKQSTDSLKCPGVNRIDSMVRNELGAWERFAYAVSGGAIEYCSGPDLLLTAHQIRFAGHM